MSPTIALQNLPGDEYVLNPSSRTIDAFFLGGVFLLSLVYIFKSPAIQSLTYSVGNVLQRRITPLSPEELEADTEEKERLRKWIEDVLLGPAESLDPKNLVFILCIFVANAGLAMFGSTLIFSKGQDVMCTFLVAWGGLSAEMIRVTGFIRLSLELRSLHSRRWEIYITWVYMLVVVAFMLFNSAIESGALRSATTIDGIYLCYRQYSVLTSLLSSLTNVLFECYAFLRLIFLLAPPFLKGEHRWDALKDIRIGMALSLLLMDLLTVVPDAVPVSIAADFIPFAITALIVLVVFNRQQNMASSTLSRVDSIPSTRMMEISQRDYDANSMIVRTPHTSRSRSIIQRRNSSASRLGRSCRRSQLPPFSLGAISVDGSSVHQKRGLRDLVISIGHPSPSTVPITPKSSSGGSFRLSGSQENLTQGQVMVAQRPVRPWPPVPPLQMPVTNNTMPEKAQEQKPNRLQSIRFSRIPPPPAGLPPLPPLPGSRSQTDDHIETPGSSEQHTQSATSGGIHGSDIIRRKRTYDPTRNAVDPDDPRRRSTTSTYLSPTNGRERSSTVSGWPRGDDWYAAPSTVSAYQTGASLRRDPGPSRPNARRKDTFGARTRRSYATYSSSHKEEKRRFSLDLTAPVPNISTEYEPASPSTAPVSRMSIVPVLPSGILSPTLVKPDTRRNAVATGVAPAADAISSTRVRFGARPMRSALIADGFRESEEEGMSREYLQLPARGFDKSQ